MRTAFLSLVVTLTLAPFLRSSSLQALPSQLILASAATSWVCSFLPSLSVIVSLPPSALTTRPEWVSPLASALPQAFELAKATSARAAKQAIKRRVTITKPPKLHVPWDFGPGGTLRQAVEPL